MGTQLLEVDARRAYLVQRLSRYMSCAAAAKAWATRTFGVSDAVAGEAARQYAEASRPGDEHPELRAARLPFARPRPTTVWTTPRGLRERTARHFACTSRRLENR